MKLRPKARFALPFLAVGLALPALSLAHDDDPKLRHLKPAVPGSGFMRGLAPAPTTVGGPGTANASGGNFPNVDVTLHAWLTLADLGGGNRGNDIWGYASPSGREYALVGVDNATVIVEVTNPDLPVVIERISGPTSIWRDIRTYQDRAYTVSEGGMGIQVIDLSDVDNGNVSLERTVLTGGSSSSHNVVVDTVSGFLYRCGGGGNGLRMYDLQSPGNPQYVSTWSDRYVHDAQVVTYTSGVYAGKQIAFCCSGLNNGWVDPTVTVLDVTNKQSIVVLSQVPYPGRIYSHQGILSEDRQRFYLGDELDEDGSIFTTTHVFDVSDLSAVAYTNSFNNGSSAVGHNMFTARGLLYQANYNDGLRIYDATSDPSQPVEIAWFDSAPNSTAATYNGMWGIYPYLPSGTLLCSDIESGLFVVSHDAPLGQTYCAAAPNSTGASATIEGVGSRNVADNDVNLTATSLPLNSTGYFIASRDQAFVMNPAGSAGNLCLGGAIGRYVNQVANSGAAGEIPVAVDLTVVPQPNGAVSVLSGETWNFQCWHRDSLPSGPTSNFTDGYSITFQ